MLSPPSNLSFQTGKFTGKSNRLSIPDTIHEQAELSGGSAKMEASGDLTVTFNCDDKENISNNQQVMCNKSSDNSKILAIDYSFIRDCERKLLENSNNDEEETTEFENKSAVNKQLLEIPSGLVHGNDSISTPPSVLRKEISILRDELAATDEFHDFEIQVLKEEKCNNQIDLQEYLQVVEKNTELIELYTSLKNEYDEYRREQEKVRDELHSKTADCLESLRSQIEASDSSLNFSSASFVSFNTGIKSSTMMDDNSEVEATVMHDATILTSDPLSITLDDRFKTPLHTPLRSAKKLFPQQMNWTSKTDVKEVNEIIDKHQSAMPLDPKCNIQLLNLEAALCDKLKEVKSLEERLFKVEDTYNTLKSDCERTTEILSKKSEQLNELTQKLFTETISLNPSLRESLIDAPGPKLLIVFIETIMEKCKNIQDELITKHNCEKTEWEAQRKTELIAIENLENQIKSLNEQISSKDSRLMDLEDLKLDLEKKLKDVENTLLTREVEMRILQTSIREVQEDFNSSSEALLKLESELSLIKAEKKQIESRSQELENNVSCLKNDLEFKDKLLLELDTAKSTVANIQRENEELKRIIQKTEEIITQLKTESLQNEKDAMQEIERLRKKEASRFDILLQGVEDFKQKMSDNPETPLRENAAFEFISEKLKECADSRFLSAVEAVMECAKVDFDSKRKLDLNVVDDLQNQIKVAHEKNFEFEIKLSEILTKNNEFNSECEDLKKHLLEVEGIVSLKDEEITRLKSAGDVLKKLKEDISSLEVLDTDDSLADRIEKLITEMPEVRENAETEDSKIVSVFVETLAKTCKSVQNEFIKRFEVKKLEWDSQRNGDLDLIETLHSKIKVLSEKNSEQEAEILKISLEREDLKKSQNDLTKRMSEAQTFITAHNEEIRSHEISLKQTKDELVVANETILKLKSELVSTESQKVEVELQCRKYEESAVSLQAEIESKETIINGLYELKEKLESDGDEVRRRILQSEDVILHLKKDLECAKEEQTTRELRIKDLLSDIDSLRREKENLMDFSERLEKSEKTNRNLVDVFSDIQSHLDLPEDTTTKLISGNLDNKKIFIEKINSLVKAQGEELRAENKNLKLGNENLKEKVKQLTNLLCETANAEIKEELSNLNASQANAMTLRSRSVGPAGKNVNLFVRRLDKLEDITHNLTELLTELLTLLEFPDLEKLRLSTVKNFSAVSQKVTAYVKGFLSRMKELKEENGQLDEECETYSNIIKDLKKEATAVWRANEEKTDAMRSEMSRMKEEKVALEKEREEMLAKLAKLEGECERLKSGSRTEGPLHSCNCLNESKKVNDLKRAILIKEQKLLELQDLEAQTSSYKSQIEYLKNALDRERKKVADEKAKNMKLHKELNEATKNQKPDSKREEQNEILEELRMRGSLNGGVVQEFVDKEKMRKLSKDIGILKELCRARYVEIKRLEALNASLRNKTPKNSNQMDSPIRSRGCVTRSKNPARDTWKTENNGKENSPVCVQRL